MKKINIGIIGFGTVGSGVVRILRERRKMLADKIGTELIIKQICDKDLASRRNVAVPKELLTADVAAVINDPQIDVIVELIGGIHPAKEFISQALKKGKHIVTANKALLAEHGKEMFATAIDNGKSIYFEASVGGGIPIIKALREGLVANKFSSIFGIVNGTSNFVLSKMSDDNCSFNEALKEAQAKGFAEKDPTLDIEGIDSAHKLVLLTYLGFGRLISLDDVFIEGISRVSLYDINYAKELGFEIKLLAIAKKEEDSLEVRVHPTLIPTEHLLASVNGVNNAMHVASDLAGNLLFFGPGAGQLSAASAVVSDLVDLTQGIKAGLFRPTLNVIEDTSVKKLRKIDEIESRYYIRFMAQDKPGVLAKIAGVLARYSISIASVTQKERRRAKSVPIVMVIHEAKEKDLRTALAIIDKMNIIHEPSVAIRIEDI
ncbi:MAG TPA: homoserine dehydrogenase [Candidatus Omnitrophota bacterium]|nr:homoserine dehydrogenase [Candidatus Omnitrophota bacterium]HRZ15119.1 homoserine dehydrogenase [Candidatus Omnitrophota bacterium]